MSEEKRRVISSRIVKRRVIGSANPVAKWGRESKSTCWDSIGGFFLGLLLFLITFSLPYCAAKTEKDSKQVAMEVTPVAQAAAVSGIATVQGNISAGSKLSVPLAELKRPVLAYDYLREAYETWIETRTETYTEVENGQEVEYTREIEEEVSGWREKAHETKWATVKLGGISIDPQRCRIDLPWEQVYSETYLDEEIVVEIRETVKVIYADVGVYLYAEFTDGQVAAEPDFYRLSTRSPEQEKEQMHKEEEGARWFKIIAALILWTISLNLMLGPAMLLINIIPIKQIGCAVRAVLTFVSFIIAAIMTFVTYTFVRYWWVFVILLIVLAVVVIVNVNQKRKAEPETELEPDADSLELDAEETD